MYFFRWWSEIHDVILCPFAVRILFLNGFLINYTVCFGDYHVFKSDFFSISFSMERGEMDEEILSIKISEEVSYKNDIF